MIPRWLERLLPVYRAIAVTIVMQSGTRIRFTCDEYEVGVNGLGQITSYRWTRARGQPLQLDATRIEACLTKPCWRWR